MSSMANYWVAQGRQVTLVTSAAAEKDGFYELSDRINRVYLNINADGLPTVLSFVRGIRNLRQLLADERPNVVLSFLTRSNILTILASLGLGVRTIVSERVHPELDTSLPFVWRVLRRVLYPRASGIVVQTEQTRHWFATRLKPRIAVIPNALRELPDGVAAREPLIVAVGRLTRQKGFDLLLRAFAPISAKYANWNVAIIGSGSGRSELSALRDRLGLADRVRFLGERDDVESWMARAGLVVQPSRFEGFPNVVLESMGMGAPVISADCRSGPAEIIESGVSGYLVPVEDVTALSDCMSKLLADSDLRADIGREARNVRKRFSEESVMRKWERCLWNDRDSFDSSL